MIYKMSGTHSLSLPLSNDEMLYELLKKQIGYYRAIYEMEKEQKDRFNQTQSLNDIKSLITKKQILYGCVAEISKAMEPLNRYWKEKKERSNESSKKVIRELGELQILLQKIKQLDVQNQTNIKNHIQFLKKSDKK
jgi:hypothetical protein